MSRELFTTRPRAARAAAFAAATTVATLVTVALADTYVPADRATRAPPAQTEVLPEKFLRGFDPITISFTSDVGAPGPVDDPAAHASLLPAWPGAWSFVDKRTLQFRPAEPWPALARFAVKAKGRDHVLTTMMTPPQAMTPDAGSAGLPPFRTFTLTFPQPLPIDALKAMLRLELRGLPGLDNAPRRPVERFALSLLPRTNDKEPATYAVTLEEEVPEGTMLVVSATLALGDDDGALWRGRLSTRTDFRLESVACGGTQLGLIGGPQTTADQALDCGSTGDVPALVFSAPVGGVSLQALKRLVRLDPAVPDLSPRVSGRRLALSGRFAPGTLYQLRIDDAPVFDDLGRRLRDPGAATVHFFVGMQRPHLRVSRGTVVVEAKGPRALPMTGFGDARADVRVHRIDARHAGLWPFPADPVIVSEESAPPFPGEEPETPATPGDVSRDGLVSHLRLLGAPPASRVVDLPAQTRRAAGPFSLDLGTLIDETPAFGARRPGTYLVGVRRLEGKAERQWARVQVTNLSLTTVAERDGAVVIVRTLDTAEPVRGATVTVEGKGEKGALARMSVTTDAQGRATLVPNKTWQRVARVIVELGDDVLVIDPRDAPQRFMNNHWSGGGSFLSFLTSEPPKARKDDATLGFLFTERPIYRPGERVYLAGYVREKRAGALQLPEPARQTEGGPLTPQKLLLKVQKPSGDEVTLATTTTELFGAHASFEEKDGATGTFVARLFIGNQREPVAVRSFLVEAYRVPTFEVVVNAPLRARLDEPFSARASARYYAGGSVAEAPIRWTVTRRPAWHTPKGHPGFLFASSLQFSRSDTGRRPDETSQSAKLDDAGSHAITVNPERDLDGSPRVYRFEAVVAGADDQEVAATTEVLALPPFSLGMKLVRYQKEAQSVAPEVIATGVDDKLLAGQKVQVRLLKRTWHSHLRESHFATGEANYVTEMQDALVHEATVTTTAAPLAVTLPAKGAGVYVVELIAKDKLGRVQTLSADLYIGGKEPQSWQKGQAGVFELAADKKSYTPGETANIIVKSPWTTAKALVIVERAAKNEYREVDVQGSVATIAIPLDKTSAPNLPVHVVLSRGRAGEAKRGVDDATLRPQTMASSLELAVEPVGNVVRVTTTHPPQARPGETIDLAIALADDKGAPVAGEATVWLVDEAVLSLAREGPLEPKTSLVTRNKQDTAVNDTRNAVLGRLMEDEAPGGDGDEDSRDAEGGGRRVRQNFQTVPFYQATVAVPASGKVKLKVALSDDLTNFKVRVTAASGAERFGHAESALKVRLPVIVQPKLPRFARQGDRFDGGGVARLVEGEDGPAVVKATYTGPVVERKRSADVALTKDVAQKVVFPVEVSAAPADGPLRVKVEVAKKKDGVGDAFEVTIPILADVTWQTSAQVVTLPAGSHTLPGPGAIGPPRPGTATQTITATHVPGLIETFAAIDVLAAYPHGCLEQKMSRLAPQLPLLRLSKRLVGVANSGALKNVERLLMEFAQHQDETGLFGYWPGTKGDLQVTARALEFAAAAREVGAVVDDGVLGRARAALEASLRSDAQLDGTFLPWRQSLRASALRALARHRQVDDGYLLELVRGRKALDATGRADVALALARAKKPSLAKEQQEIAGELWESVVFNVIDGRRAVVGLSDPRAVWGGRLLGSDTAALATVLEALVRTDPSNKDLPLLFDAVVQRGRGGLGFGSTYDNRAATEAVLAYIDVATPKLPTSKLTVDGEARALDDANKLVRLERQKDTPLAASVTGAPVTAMVRWRQLPAERGDAQPALKQGLLVQRSVTIYAAGGGPAQAPRRVEDVRGAELKLSQGDVLELHTTITVDQDMSHVALVVPFAAGLEPMNSALQNASSDAVTAERDTLPTTYVARLDDEARYYVTSLPKGTYTVHARVKATTTGSFTHPGAWAERMYDERVRGRSVGSRVIVTAASEDG